MKWTLGGAVALEAERSTARSARRRDDGYIPSGHSPAPSAAAAAPAVDRVRPSVDK